MKITVKQYNEKVQERKTLKNLIYEADTNNDWSMVELLKVSLQILEDEFFALVDAVCVKYWIGYRTYYQEVHKIGKTYFCSGEKMTKRNGYRSIEEIEEITDKMKESMIADSHYY